MSSVRGSTAYTPINYYYTHNEETYKNIYKKCVEPSATQIYIFFSYNETSPIIYCIKTGWVVQHHKKIRSSLINQGMYVFKSNPWEKCGWIENKNYGWPHDEVWFKGNMTDELDVVANIATNQSCTIEWVLIFSWAILIGLGLIIWAIIAIIMHYKKKRKQDTLLD